MTRTDRRPPLARQAVCTALGLFAGAVALVWLVRGGEAVTALAGVCTSGGSARPGAECPQGLPGLMAVAFAGGGIGWLVYAALGLPIGPRIAALAWPALCGAWAWTFTVHGLDGPSWGFLATAVLFLVLGLGPLMWLTAPAQWHRILWSDGPSPRPRHDLALTGAGRGPAHIPDDGTGSPVRVKTASAVLQVVTVAIALVCAPFWFDALTS